MSGRKVETAGEDFVREAWRGRAAWWQGGMVAGWQGDGVTGDDGRYGVPASIAVHQGSGRRIRMGSV